MRLGCLAIAIAFMISHAAHGGAAQNSSVSRVFHVDALRGDDHRNGLTPETAWRSLDRVNNASLKPGDAVLFRRGQSWRGQLRPQSGDAKGIIRYSAFGEGPKPLLLGSVAMDRSDDWQPCGEGVWATVPVRFEPIGTQTNLRRARWWVHREGVAACTLTTLPTDGDGRIGFRLDCRQKGTEGKHIQLIVSGLEVTEGSYYLLVFRARSTRPFTPGQAKIMKDGAPYTTYASAASELPAIGNAWGEHTIRFRANQTASDARLTFYLGDSLPADTSLFIQPQELLLARCNQSIPLDVDVGNIIFDGGQSTGYKKWQEADLRDEGDYFYDARTGQVKLRSPENPARRHRSIEMALRKHIIDQGGRSYIAYQDLALKYGAAHGIGGGGTHHITVRDCDVAYIGGGHQFTRPDGKPVRFGNGVEFWSGARDCVVEGCRLWEIYDAALTNQGDGVNVQENITYRHNVIWNCEYSFEYWNRGTGSRTQNIRFEHNTCVNAGYGWGHRQRPDPNGRHLMFYDNVAVTEGVVIRFNIFSQARHSCLRLSGRDWTAGLVLDRNCWFQSAGPMLLWQDKEVASADFLAFQRQRGLDGNSLVADPKFLNASHNDYRLAPDSPARGLANVGHPAGALP